MTLARQILITLALIVVAMFAINRYALGFDGEYPERYERPERKPQVRAFVQRHKPAPSRVITKAVIAPVKPDARCKPFVAALGDTAKSEAAAKLEAQKQWKVTTNWMYGSRYMDLKNADTIEYMCGPSNPPRLGGLVEQQASRFLPITDYICRISAQPCDTPVQRDLGK